MSAGPIQVNIWDDYYDDGFVPEGSIQETYAYVEGGDLADDESRAVLLQLQQTVESLKVPGSNLVCCIEWYDSALVYPNLVGTEHERHLFRRWHLQLRHLPHREREDIVDVLGRLQLEYDGRPIVVYSES
jgi:hypothetical protein